MKSFRLLGVKGFLDTGEIELRPITVVIGQNSSGKSSILRFPLVLKQTLLDDSMAPLLFYGRSIDYGSFEDVVFNHERDRTIGFRVSVDTPMLVGYIPAFRRTTLYDSLPPTSTVCVRISRHEDELRVDEFTIEMDKEHEPFLRLRRSGQSAQFEYSIGQESPVRVAEGELGFDKFLPNFFILRQTLAERALREGNDLAGFGDLLFALRAYLNDAANSVFYIGPFRRTPERFYRHKENAVDYVGSDGEFAPVILAQDLRRGRRLVNAVSQWLADNLGFTLDIEDWRGEIFRILVTDRETRATNNLIDVGHGLSQLIPVIVQSLMPRRPRYRSRGELRVPDLHIIEQPELHLHPAAQSSLADLFVLGIGAQDQRSRRRHFLIETHSEHMLIRLRRYIVEGRLKPDDVALYYTEKLPKEGTLGVRRLTVDEEGRIADWPEGFFAEDFREVMALRKLVRTRRQEEKQNPW